VGVAVHRCRFHQVFAAEDEATRLRAKKPLATAKDDKICSHRGCQLGEIRFRRQLGSCVDDDRHVVFVCHGDNLAQLLKRLAAEEEDDCRSPFTDGIAVIIDGYGLLGAHFHKFTAT
jgi:hypothetical protein